jgi:hypothetical protein
MLMGRGTENSIRRRRVPLSRRSRPTPKLTYLVQILSNFKRFKIQRNLLQLDQCLLAIVVSVRDESREFWGGLR